MGEPIPLTVRESEIDAVTVDRQGACTPASEGAARRDDGRATEPKRTDTQSSAEDGNEPEPLLVIRPGQGWQAINLRELWQFRDLLTVLAGRDVKLRYRQTALGPLWVVLQPLLGAGIFSFVFGSVAGLPSDGLPYFLFAYAGLLGWNAFNTTLAKSQASLVSNAHLVSKVYFPRLILPISTVFSTIIDFAVALCLMLVVMAAYGVTPHVGLLLLPVWLVLLLLLAVGIGLLTSAVAVTYRDVVAMTGPLLTLVLYASPVAYAVSAVPERMRALYFLNPLASLLEGVRWSLLGNGTMPWTWAAYAAGAAVVVFVMGAFSFRKMERRFADVI
jgi:lipopolysaccharide transport system permease protein